MAAYRIRLPLPFWLGESTQKFCPRIFVTPVPSGFISKTALVCCPAALQNDSTGLHGSLATNMIVPFVPGVTAPAGRPVRATPPRTTVPITAAGRQYREAMFAPLVFRPGGSVPHSSMLTRLSDTDLA